MSRGTRGDISTASIDGVLIAAAVTSIMSPHGSSASVFRERQQRLGVVAGDRDVSHPRAPVPIDWMYSSTILRSAALSSAATNHLAGRRNRDVHRFTPDVGDGALALGLDLAPGAVQQVFLLLPRLLHRGRALALGRLTRLGDDRRGFAASARQELALLFQRRRGLWRSRSASASCFLIAASRSTVICTSVGKMYLLSTIRSRTNTTSVQMKRPRVG